MPQNVVKFVIFKNTVKQSFVFHMLLQDTKHDFRVNACTLAMDRSHKICFEGRNMKKKFGGGGKKIYKIIEGFLKIKL